MQQNLLENDTAFGWKAIIDQYSCDKCRQDQGCAPRVPGLRYNFVYRYVWTRLNVQPAKIMQADLKGNSQLVHCAGNLPNPAKIR